MHFPDTSNFVLPLEHGKTSFVCNIRYEWSQVIALFSELSGIKERFKRRIGHILEFFVESIDRISDEFTEKIWIQLDLPIKPLDDLFYAPIRASFPSFFGEVLEAYSFECLKNSSWVGTPETKRCEFPPRMCFIIEAITRITNNIFIIAGYANHAIFLMQSVSKHFFQVGFVNVTKK